MIAEALATTRRLTKEGRTPPWSFPPAEERRFPFDLPFQPGEVTHGIFEAWLTFAMFENAHRGHLGMPLDEYRRSLGELLSPMTGVAASNPFAWFRTERSVEEITDPTGQNRMVGVQRPPGVAADLAIGRERPDHVGERAMVIGDG